MLLTAWENEQALVEKKEKEVSGRGRGHTRGSCSPQTASHHGGEERGAGPSALSGYDCLLGGAGQPALSSCLPAPQNWISVQLLTPAS